MTPKHINTSFNRSFLTILVAPLVRMRDEFELLHSNYLLYRARLTGQVAVLERHLNLTYDPAFRRIRIEDTESDNPITLYRRNERSTQTVILFRKSEQRPVFLTPKNANTELNYLIVLPDSILDCRNRANLLKIIATINLFRCAGKAFGIKQYGQIFTSL
jgi:hypothetical protein